MTQHNEQYRMLVDNPRYRKEPIYAGYMGDRFDYTPYQMLRDACNDKDVQPFYSENPMYEVKKESSQEVYTTEEHASRVNVRVERAGNEHKIQNIHVSNGNRNGYILTMSSHAELKDFIKNLQKIDEAIEQENRRTVPATAKG